MIQTTKNARVNVAIIALVILSCSAMENNLIAQQDIPLQEPATISLTPSTILQVYPNYGCMLAFSQWENFILIYDVDCTTLKETIEFSDEIAERIFPKIGEDKIKYRYAPESETIYLMPYQITNGTLKLEIMTARMIRKDIVACIAYVKGPWQIEREENNEGIGLVPVLFTYDLRLKKLLEIELLVPWLEDYTWNSAIISKDGTQVVIGMTGDRDSDQKNNVKIIQQDLITDNVSVIYETEMEQRITNEILFSWETDSLLCSIDLRNVFNLNGHSSTLCVSETALANYFTSSYRLSSVVMEDNGDIVLGVYAQKIKNTSEAHCLLIRGDTVIADRKIDITMPGKTCYFSASADAEFGLMFSVDTENAYIRKLDWR